MVHSTDDPYWVLLQEYISKEGGQSDALGTLESLPVLINFKLAKALNVGEMVTSNLFEVIHPLQNYILDEAADNEMLFFLTSKGYSSKNTLSLRFEAHTVKDFHIIYAEFKSGDFDNIPSMQEGYDKSLSSFQSVTNLESFSFS